MRSEEYPNYEDFKKFQPVTTVSPRFYGFKNSIGATIRREGWLGKPASLHIDPSDGKEYLAFIVGQGDLDWRLADECDWERVIDPIKETYYMVGLVNKHNTLPGFYELPGGEFYGTAEQAWADCRKHETVYEVSVTIVKEVSR